ncbi:MAG TPA: DUF692 family protein, partial [Xanthobacteraceae bacterium]
MAGGVALPRDAAGRRLLADSHSHPVPDAAYDLLDHMLLRQNPQFIVLERDDRLDAVDEIMDDVDRIRAHVARAHSQARHGRPVAEPTG